MVDLALPRLRVRSNRYNYSTPFAIDLGQRNAELITRPITPLRRLFLGGGAIAFAYDADFDMFHTYNAIPVFTEKPFVVSFEDYLPRTPDDQRRGWRELYVGRLERWLRSRLLSGQCVALLAGSEYAQRQFLHQHRGYSRLGALRAKLEVMYPAIPPFRRHPKTMFGELKVLFVGNDFMRKGGPIVLRAHEILRRSGVPVHTTIVSSLRQKGCYVAPASTSLSKEETRRLDNEGIRFYRGLPNPTVIDLLQQADYLVLPTFHDTFGFSCIEALACGTPVVGTNTCALPEIVEHGRSGYLLPFENDLVIGKWVWLYRERDPGYTDAYLNQVKSSADALARQLAACWNSRCDYEALSAGALARAEERFSIGPARTRLELLYERCRAAGRRLPVAPQRP